MLMFSTVVDPTATVYPDSDKVGIWTGDPETDVMVRRDSAVDYYDGEDGAAGDPTGPTPSPDQERSTPRGGDEAAFERLVGPYRRELHAHCYRMLGSLHDTEEAMQEALLRVWRNLDAFDGPRLAARLALPDRHQRQPRPDRPPQAAAAAGRVRPGGRPQRSRRASRWSRRSGSSPTPTRSWGSRMATPRRTRATSSARRSSWPSSPRCSTCRRASGRC